MAAPTDPFATVWRYFEHLVATNDTTSLTQYLPKLPLGDLDMVTFIDMFVHLATIAARMRAKGAFQLLLARWQEETVNDDDTPPFDVFLFTRSAVPDEVLQFMVEAVHDISGVAVIQELLAWPDAAPDALERCMRVFGRIHFQPEDVHMLIETAMNRNREDLANTLQYMYSTLVADAPVPSWMRPPRPDAATARACLEQARRLAAAREPRDDALAHMNSATAVDMYVEVLTQNVPRQGRDNARNAVRALIQMMTPEEQRATVNEAYRAAARLDLGEVAELTRLVGPPNPTAGLDLSDPTHECAVFGGCRMFLCLCIEQDEMDLEQRPDDWFTGICDACSVGIASRWYAVRQPVGDGGWLGCYCSVACVETRAANELDYLLMRNMETILHEVGVYERHDDDDDADIDTDTDDDAPPTKRARGDDGTDDNDDAYEHEELMSSPESEEAML